MKPFRRSTHQATAGYTLIEVIAVVVIVGVLAAIAAPSWLQYLNNRRMGAVNSDLVQSLKQAQQEAIKQRQRVKVTVDAEAAVPTINVDYRVPVGEGVDTPGDGADIPLGQGAGIRPGLMQLEAPADETLIFDYQGLIREQTTLPYVIKVSMASNPGRQHCVIVASLIGTIKTAQDAECDAPDVEIE